VRALATAAASSSSVAMSSPATPLLFVLPTHQ
jgi:hypothetical protein